MSFFIVSKKSLGQNFLIDKNIINKIVKIENIEKNHTILEIGAGYGNLTKAIADMNPQKIYAIEKDRKLSVHLEKRFENYNNVKIIIGGPIHCIACFVLLTTFTIIYMHFLLF